MKKIAADAAEAEVNLAKSAAAKQPGSATKTNPNDKVFETSSLSADNVLDGSVDYCLDYLEKHGKLENLYENARRWPNPLPASCACSGSGAWAWVVDAWTNCLSDRLAIALNATHVFTCDIKGNRQWWLMNSKLTGDRYCCCFDDVRSLGKERAACSKRKMDGRVLSPMISSARVWLQLHKRVFFQQFRRCKSHELG